MSITDFFTQEGTVFPVNGSNPQILDDSGYVWLVADGKVSVFLTDITKNNSTGAKKSLFEVNKGNILWGMTPVNSADKKCLLASGTIGAKIIRLDRIKFKSLFKREEHDEVVLLVKIWLDTLGNLIKNSDILDENTVYLKENRPETEEYIGNSEIMESYHNKILEFFTYLWDTQNENEKNHLYEKMQSDKRLMANSVAEFASINQKSKTIIFNEASGDPLLDTCRLIGRYMNIEFKAPPVSSHGEHSKPDLDDIARVSRIRTREVSLKGEWYKQDSGIILGYMKEDNRPVALIPQTVSKYMLHDLTYGITRIVDKAAAQEIKNFGFMFYRPFDNKKIKIKDLLLFGYKSCWKKDFAVIIIMGILGGILGTAVPLATGIIFSSIIPEGEKSSLLQVALFLAASTAAIMLFQLTRSLAALRIEGKMEGSVQASVWDRLLSLPVSFFKQFSAGELAMRAMGISQIRAILSGVTLNTILSSIFSVFTFGLLFYYNIKLASVSAILIILSVIFMGCLSRRQVYYERKILGISNSISGMLLQLLEGINKFHVAGAESRVFSQWAKMFGAQRRLTIKKQNIGNCITTFNAFFSILSSMIIFYTLTSSDNLLSPGQFIAFNSAFISLMVSMSSLSESLVSANIVIPLYDKAKPILETLPEDDDNKIIPKALTGSLEVSHISFRYNENSPLILKGISFQINEGDYVALVGTSGCGKSTLFRILLGFEKPETGKVYYSGQDLSKVDIRAVRRQLGVVLQNDQLMTGNIFSNIVGSNPYLTIDDAWEAARMAGIEDDIKEMPMGMFTVISEGASTISGGQKQRLMIARAILKKPKIIFFDEATSALDNRTQAIVSNSLDKLQATRVVIAHRLSTVINCNKIFVMDKGEIVESGTYEELIKNNGLFTELAKRQLS